MFRGRKKSNDCNSGQQAEQFAREYLRSHRLKVIDTNYTTPRGEIDIIARDGDTLVFVEVRLRSHSAYGGAAESIDKHKRRRVIFAATHYLQTQGLWDKVSCRFDTLCLAPNPDNRPGYHVEWLPAAFSADE